MFFEWFGYKVLGEDYYLGIGDNGNLYDGFNSAFEGKLLVFIDEASGKDNHTQADRLKAKITSKKTLVNRKNVPQYTVDDYARYAFATNNKNPLRVGMGDRRIVAYDVNDDVRGDEDYFNSLVKAMDDPLVVVGFYLKLMAMETYKSPIEFQRNRPITRAYVDMRRMNAPLITKWIVDKLRAGRLRDGLVSRLFQNFQDWCVKTKERADGERSMTLTAFGRLLNDNHNLMRFEDAETDDEEISLGVKKDDAKGSKLFQWNYKALTEHLEKLFLLNPGEVTLDEKGKPPVLITDEEENTVEEE